MEKGGNNLINTTHNQYSAKEEGAYQLVVSNSIGCTGYSSTTRFFRTPLEHTKQEQATNKAASSYPEY